MYTYIRRRYHILPGKSARGGGGICVVVGFLTKLSFERE